MTLPLRIAPALPGLLLLVAFQRAPAPMVREIRMTSRFAPAEISARAGDTLRFINQTSGPHNIQFFVDSIPETARALLEGANAGGKDRSPLESAAAGRERQIRNSGPGAVAGPLSFVCLPHFAGGMRGTLVVVP